MWIVQQITDTIGPRRCSVSLSTSLGRYSLIITNSDEIADCQHCVVCANSSAPPEFCGIRMLACRWICSGSAQRNDENMTKAVLVGVGVDLNMKERDFVQDCN